LRASGLRMEPLEGFEGAFETLIEHYAAFMDESVERYLEVYPAAISWHHDLVNQYEKHSVIAARQAGKGLILTFDHGLKAFVPSPDYVTTTSDASEKPDAALDSVGAHILE
jgi:hypothetical protein